MDICYECMNALQRSVQGSTLYIMCISIVLHMHNNEAFEYGPDERSVCRGTVQACAPHMQP